VILKKPTTMVFQLSTSMALERTLKVSQLNTCPLAASRDTPRAINPHP